MDILDIKIGTHITKSKKFYSSLQKFYDIVENKFKPTQLFTGSTRSWRRPELDKIDIDKTKNYVRDNKLRVYIHSIYFINLSRCKEEFMDKAFACLIYELQIGKMLGFKGVVVHCGKALKLSKEEALDNMYNNIMEIYNTRYISKSCPLLIETSAGQGTEVCWEIDCFKKFYNRFTNEEKKYIKICIDTCHVFVAGHNPYEYLQSWYISYPKSIVLVHYNDSKVERGSRKDRHAYPGKGFIGEKNMKQIADWCIQKEIPMVIE